jgi:mono/diheme cytochrome c family protein/DNA-binding beta-propeller fold protein YncE
VTLPHAPPAISGGTLLIEQGGAGAVASDPDRDQLYAIDLAMTELLATIPLLAGDEPGRLVEDSNARVHVALRGGGAVVTLDLATNEIIDRRAVCPAPRGIAFDPSTDNLYVACNGGELVTLPAAGGPPTRTAMLLPDLRDVVVRSGSLLVSRFRQAEVLEVDGEGNVTAFGSPPDSSNMHPTVAWRMISSPPSSASSSATVAMVHQRAQRGTVSTNQGGYGQSGSGCSETSIVEATVTEFRRSVAYEHPAPAVPGAVLPVDIAVSPDGAAFAIVAAGNAKADGKLPGVFFLPRRPEGALFGDGFGCAASVASTPVPGQVTAVALASSTVAWVQTREPAALLRVEQTGIDKAAVMATIALSSVSREDTGHSIVHSNSGRFLACASCHAEGGDDAHVWKFPPEKGQTSSGRRTQSLRGTIEGTAPYHWEGDMKDIDALAHEVFVKRMGGQTLTSDEIDALRTWLNAVPRPKASPAADPSAVARGEKLFQSSDVGCSLCHSGARFTNNQTMDVGTGGKFQVPSLVGVGWRAPYFHDGRAPQLIDRFNPELAGANHGHTSQLSAAQIDDLVSYLQTL